MFEFGQPAWDQVLLSRAQLFYLLLRDWSEPGNCSVTSVTSFTLFDFPVGTVLVILSFLRTNATVFVPRFAPSRTMLEFETFETLYYLGWAHFRLKRTFHLLVGAFINKRARILQSLVFF